MIKKPRLFTPGPTPLHPDVQAALARPILHHRTDEFRATFRDCAVGLKAFLKTADDVLILACSGTGAMEAALVNVLSPGDAMLALVAGNFGERWAAIGRAHAIASLARITRGRPGTLLVVDAISGAGAMRLDTAAWGVDVVVVGSQKALALPPGLAFLAVSARAWERMDAATAPRFYFDLRRERKAQGAGEGAFTPAISHVAALKAALDS